MGILRNYTFVFECKYGQFVNLAFKYSSNDCFDILNKNTSW